MSDSRLRDKACWDSSFLVHHPRWTALTRITTQVSKIWTNKHKRRADRNFLSESRKAKNLSRISVGDLRSCHNNGREKFLIFLLSTDFFIFMIFENRKSGESFLWQEHWLNVGKGWKKFEWYNLSNSRRQNALVFRSF